MHELVRLPEPLAPESAALLSGRTLPTVDELARRTVEVAGDAEAVLVEGAGGVAVRLDRDGGTLLDLGSRAGVARDARARSTSCWWSAPALGTLNHTELSLDAIRRAGLDVRGLVVGSWPAEPGLAERTNARTCRDDRRPGARDPAGGRGGRSPRAAFTRAAARWCTDLA